MAAQTRINDLECLRGIAIVFVLIVHLPALIGRQPSEIFTFAAGVDLFFAISGFVITRSLLPYLGSKSFREFAFPFWIRRATRLLPAAWLWVLIGLLASAFSPDAIKAFGSLYANARDAIPAVLQVANFHFWACDHLKLDLCAVGGVPFGIYWSLSLEEQFYALFPFVLYFCPRRHLPWFLGALALAQIFLPRSHADSSLYILWYVRTDALALGALLAIAANSDALAAWEPRFLCNPVWRVGIVAIFVLALAWLPTHTPWGLETGALAVISAAWVFVASFDKGYAMPGRWVEPVMLWIGSRSYAMYLCHLFAYRAAVSRWPKWPFGDEPGLILVALALTGICAELTYRLVEQPMREMGRVVASRKTFTTPAPDHLGNRNRAG